MALTFGLLLLEKCRLLRVPDMMNKRSSGRAYGILFSLFEKPGDIYEHIFFFFFFLKAVLCM